MSKISTYSNVSPIALTDKLIGTNTSGTPANVTKNFLVSDLQTVIISAVNLQHVLDTGNTATQNITLTGNITQTGTHTVTGDITQSGGAITLGGTVKDFNGSLGNNGETLVCNASGQLVFGSGLTNQNLDQVLAIGNTATNDINLTGNLNLTGNMTMIGDPDITGDVTHSGNYLFEVGQFSFEGTSTVLLEGAVKDSTGTLGSDGKVLVSDASGKLNWQSTVPSTNTTVDAATDPSANANVIFYSASSGGGTIYLSAALNVAGKKVVLVRKSTTTAANIAGSGGALVNGAATKALPTTLYSVTTCISDGTDWYCNNGTPL